MFYVSICLFADEQIKNKLDLELEKKLKDISEYKISFDIRPLK